jgi:hypothetical protein
MGEVFPPALLVGLKGFTIGPLSPPWPPWPPYMVFSSIRALDDKLRLDLGTAGFPTYVLESSFNFTNWTAVLTSRFSPVTIELPFDRTNSSSLFYRLRMGN